MKRKLIALGLALSMTGLMYAQKDIFNNPDNHSYLGVRLSYELSCPGDIDLGNSIKMDAYGNGSGFSAGVVYHIPVIYNFYFEPGAMLAYNTYSINKDAVANFFPAGTTNVVKNASARMWKLRVPVLGGYSFDILPDMSVNVFTGPELVVGLKGTNHFSVDSNPGFTANVALYGSDGQQNRFDVMWRFGAGVTYREHYNISISGAAGICDQIRKDPKMRTNVFDITLGYNF